MRGASAPPTAVAEVYELPLPAVVGVKEGINLPRYPTLKGRLASKKVDVEPIAASAPEPAGWRWCGLRRPPEQAATTVVLGHGPDAAPAVVDLLVELGVCCEPVLVLVEHDRGSVVAGHVRGV